MDKDNCSRHSKQVAGIADMKLLAENIGDLHYEVLAEFLDRLGQKLWEDGKKDEAGGRLGLATKLGQASNFIGSASNRIKDAWLISKPFMDKTDNNG